ncbi:CDP-glycerol glycerophosphotransferase family protein, partial [Bacillus sp. D-CC]
ENGVLELSGYFLMLPWNTREETEITKKLVMRSENNTWKIPVNNVKRTDVTAFYGQSGESYDWTGFSVQLDFRKDTYGLENNKSTQIFIEMEYKGEVVLLPVIIPHNMVFNNCAIINTLEGIKKVLFSTDQESNQGYILLNREDLQAEVNCIYSEDNQITIVGEVIQQQRVEKFSEEPTSLIIKKRNTEEKYEFEIELDGLNYAHTFNLEDLVSKGLFGKGIWDIYLKINNHSYRLVTRLDGITNKQKVINIPQQLLSDLEGQAIVIKPYYTLHDEVSILVREYLNVKSIQEVKIEKDSWTVSGKMNIQTPNEMIPVQTNGSMTIKGSYGKRNKIPVIWNLERNEKLYLL